MLDIPAITTAVILHSSWPTCVVRTDAGSLALSYLESEDGEDHAAVLAGLKKEVITIKDANDVITGYKHKYSIDSTKFPNNQHSNLWHKIKIRIKYKPHWNWGD